MGRWLIQFTYENEKLLSWYSYVSNSTSALPFTVEDCIMYWKLGQTLSVHCLSFIVRLDPPGLVSGCGGPGGEHLSLPRVWDFQSIQDFQVHSQEWWGDCGHEHSVPPPTCTRPPLLLQQNRHVYAVWLLGKMLTLKVESIVCFLGVVVVGWWVWRSNLHRYNLSDLLKFLAKYLPSVSWSLKTGTITISPCTLS